MSYLTFFLTCWQRDDRVKFFCLQVLEHHVRSRHASSSDDDILALRKLLMAWIQLRHQEVGQSEVGKRRVVECVLGLGGEQWWTSWWIKKPKVRWRWNDIYMEWFRSGVRWRYRFSYHILTHVMLDMKTPICTVGYCHREAVHQEQDGPGLCPHICHWLPHQGKPRQFSIPWVTGSFLVLWNETLFLGPY